MRLVYAVLQMQCTIPLTTPEMLQIVARSLNPIPIRNIQAVATTQMKG